MGGKEDIHMKYAKSSLSEKDIGTKDSHTFWIVGLILAVLT